MKTFSLALYNLKNWKKNVGAFAGLEPTPPNDPIFVFNVESRGSEGKTKWPPDRTTVYGVSNKLISTIQ